MNLGRSPQSSLSHMKPAWASMATVLIARKTLPKGSAALSSIMGMLPSEKGQFVSKWKVFEKVAVMVIKYTFETHVG